MIPIRLADSLMLRPSSSPTLRWDSPMLMMPSSSPLGSTTRKPGNGLPSGELRRSATVTGFPDFRHKTNVAVDAARARARAREMIVDASSREHPKVPNRPRPNLVDKLKSLIDKYGDDLGHYGDCGGKKCLTDSEEGAGGDTVFPLVGEDGLSVSPQKGTALTWLNIHADGLLKEKSLHGVQATTHESSGRTIITQKFFLPPEELPEVTGQASSIK